MANASDNCDISVVIPLYNKAAEIERTLRSVLSQSLLPREIIVVDDGSTDGSAEIVERIGDNRVTLIRQENRGVSAARNRAIATAKGRWVALLDGDDVWMEDYLKTVADMIARWPDCGAYGVRVLIDDGKNQSASSAPTTDGIVDFFAESMKGYVLIASATTINRDVVLELGGFPEGMRMGEDQYLWTKIARKAPIAFHSQPKVIYSRAATNRSAASYTPEKSNFSLEDLYDPAQSDISNEYVARVALGKALIESAKGGTGAAKRALKFFAYNKLSHRIARKVRLLNTLPAAWRPSILALYNHMAWLIARKGL